ncbi:arginase family protein [Candidatus Enterococcus ferrettii]|uniref:Arginase n=1 Tax=Candidatus Enterococcus ferrettii TaxID=2815324 RepID=A0ABV0ET25_9ENTE|nr:arginase family protein [Enterococcus sp. 665A]MBO1342600.1 arginase family protein [Enterococcus sp. 665A]
MSKKTIRLLFPQWQGGNNRDYYFGAELLAHIVPQNEQEKLIRIPVNQAFDQPLPIEHGIEGASQLMEQLTATTEILEEENPDKIIILGGDCAVSQAPFDYLAGRYKNNLGILWLDAHPDVATIKDSTRDHEMVLGNLLGKGAPLFAHKVKNVINPENVFFAGLIYDELRPRDQEVNRLNLRHAAPEKLRENSQPILEWIQENQIKELAVHFDLDVLSPQDFRSIYPAEPHLKEFDAAIGSLTLQEVTRILTDTSKQTDIVGLSIAEHMPWDAINLRKALSQISIFNEKG